MPTTADFKCSSLEKGPLHEDEVGLRVVLLIIGALKSYLLLEIGKIVFEVGKVYFVCLVGKSWLTILEGSHFTPVK